MSMSIIALIIIFGILLFSILTILFNWDIAEDITDFIDAFFDAFNNEK